MIKISLVIIFTLLGISKSMSDTFKTVDGAIIDFEVKGEGSPLVMLHSGMMSREDMRQQIDHFSNYYQVVAIDARGQGRSSSSSRQISYQIMANDLMTIIDHLKINKFSIFGQSDGAITALIATHLNQHKIEKLIIHGAVYHYSAYPIEQRENWKNIKWSKDDPRDNDPNGFPGMTIESYLLGRSDLSNFESHLKEMANMWATSPNLNKNDLNEIMVPTLVIVGDHYDISISHTIEMYEALGNAELFVAPGATHFIHQEKPDLLNKVIYDFLKK